MIETANYSAGVLNQYVEQPANPRRTPAFGRPHHGRRLHLDAARQRLVVEIDMTDPEFFKQLFPRSTNDTPYRT